jgi:hypothetical protein
MRKPGGHENTGIGMKRKHEELSSTVLATAIEVHRWLGPGFAIVKPYLRGIGKEHGLLLNFAKPTPEVKRAIQRAILSWFPNGSEGLWVSG